MAKLHKNKNPELLVNELKELAGKDLSPEELQQLLNSDLEREALEGFAAMKKAGVSSDKALFDLQHQLNQKIKDRSRQRELPWHKLSIAATVAAVVCIGAFYIIKKQNREQKLAELAKQPLMWVSKDTLIIYLPKEELIAVAQNPPKAPTKPHAPIAPIPADNGTPISVMVMSAPVESSKEIIANAEKTEEKALKEVVVTKANGIHTAAKAKLAPASYTLQLLDILTSIPVADVLIKTEGSATTRKSNENGEFEVNVSVDKQNYVLSKQGYVTQTISISAEDSDRSVIGLMPDLKLQANTAIKEYLQSNKALASEATLAISESAYRIYINKNIKYPKAYTEMGKEGTVQLEFTVNTDGSLQNFIVLKSMGADFDTPSIDVLKNGPKWLPAFKNGKPIAAKARYFVNFIQL
ncbi:energy transducer TonB [Solitalea sp. MAHUQ-68]|uniref:Energy transducer TonB n=1 Tax=Solitalea agri TaxID=2953739 RepID=A0A9X2JC66_9SPHI|nr:energy transducer TonB [Solitalea agri]MCO4292748.1 energy transducer TonB [Solitalea agri]